MRHLKRLSLLSVNFIESVLFSTADRACVVNILERASRTTLSSCSTSFFYRQRRYHTDSQVVNPKLTAERPIEKFTPTPIDTILDASDIRTRADIAGCFRVYENFITEVEEKALFDEVEPYLKRLKYEADHWDDVCK